MRIAREPTLPGATTNSESPGAHGTAQDFLSAIDADWARLIARIGPCTLRVELNREPYEALVRAIAYQQIHGRAAAAILGRFLALYPGTSFPAPDSILATESSLLRGVGFSGSKVASIRAIAEATMRGVVPTRFEAALLDDETLIERMVSIRGVGRWTVEMMLMHTLGRPDILPVDDYGVRKGWQIMHGLPQQATPKQLTVFGHACKPYRSIAAWYLWRAADEALHTGDTASHAASEENP